MRTHRLRADAYHFGARIFKNLVAVPESANLRCAATREIFWVEEEHNGFFSEEILEADHLSRLVWKSEIWGFVSNFDFAFFWLFLAHETTF